jgi:hypothetical protein
MKSKKIQTDKKKRGGKIGRIIRRYENLTLVTFVLTHLQRQFIDVTPFDP